MTPTQTGRTTSPKNAGSAASIIARVRLIGARQLIAFSACTLAVWGAVSIFSIRNLVQERRHFFQILVESNQEIIASGQWRPFFEGMERDAEGGFHHLRLCWGETSEAECGPFDLSSPTSIRVEKPVLQSGRPLAWVRAEISPQPALVLSAVLLAALLATGVIALALMLRLRKESELAKAQLALVVAEAATGGNRESLTRLPEELRPLGEALLESISRLQVSREREAAAKAQWEMANQVAHDVRSPLATLRSLLRPAGEGLPNDERMLLGNAANRIQDIVESLLRRHRHVEPASKLADIRLLILTLIAEKRALSKSSLRIDFTSLCEGETLAFIQPIELSRIVSNLFDNAIQACLNGEQISVQITNVAGGFLAVSMSDRGQGIPPDVLPKLGQRGATFGKEGGTGLGLWHAKTTVESWGGRLEIESELGKGTTVRLILPRAEPPGPEAASTAAILIDDDPLVRMNWTVAAKRAGKALRVYPDAPSFIKEAADFPRDTPVYIDSDLGGGVKGEEAAKELAALGFTELRLATGHDPASFPPLPHLKGIQGKEPPWPTA